MRGKVKWYDFRKGYGFIVTDRGDVFFNVVDILSADTPKHGDLVDYEKGSDRDGRVKAVKVLILENGLRL